MTSIQQGYSVRYEHSKNTRNPSLSPSPLAPHRSTSPAKPTHAGDQLGKVVATIAERVDSVEIKIANLTNIVKLMQKYTQAKDLQYEKQKQNEEFRRGIGERVTSIEALDLQNKINEFEAIASRAKAQITAMESLRVGIQRQQSKKSLYSPEPFETLPRTINSPSMSVTYNQREIMDEIDGAIDRIESNLREEMNKKMDICMSFLKNNQNVGKNVSPSAINTIMMQEQLHNLTLTVSKVESDCLKNKMIIENKIEQIIDYVNGVAKSRSLDEGSRIATQSRSASRKNKKDNDENKSEKSSVSKRSKSISKSKSKSKSRNTVTDRKSDETQKVSSFTKIEDSKKQKQQQLKEALRKKKQNQEKLKMKK